MELNGTQLVGGGGNRRVASHKIPRRKIAFTLAEVLITLGIIGVVAAMTLPVLIQNYKKNVVETRLQKFYSSMNQAIKQSEVDNGDKLYWDKMGTNSEVDGEIVTVGGLSPVAWYNKYLAKYLKVLKVAAGDNTFNKNLGLIYFPDGSLVQFDAGGWLFFPEAKDYEKCYAMGNPLECSGRKYFAFVFNPNSTEYYMNNKGLETYKWQWDGKRTTLLGETKSGYSYRVACTKEIPLYGRSYCSALIEASGWKIPKDYPVNF